MNLAPAESNIVPFSEDPAVSAEREREQIVQDDLLTTWRGTVLQPWSEERQRLLDALCAIDVPPPSPDSDALAFYHGMFPRAVKALYLAHHKPEDWQHLRARLISVIDTWGITHVPADTVREKIDAVNFVIKLESAHRKLQALHRPQRRSGADDAGNAPSL